MTHLGVYHYAQAILLCYMYLFSYTLTCWIILHLLLESLSFEFIPVSAASSGQLTIFCYTLDRTPVYYNIQDLRWSSYSLSHCRVNRGRAEWYRVLWARPKLHSSPFLASSMLLGHPK